MNTVLQEYYNFYKNHQEQYRLQFGTLHSILDLTFTNQAEFVKQTTTFHRKKELFYKQYELNVEIFLI